jgi:hypothetical protein
MHTSAVTALRVEHARTWKLKTQSNKSKLLPLKHARTWKLKIQSNRSKLLTAVGRHAKTKKVEADVGAVDRSTSSAATLKIPEVRSDNDEAQSD